MESAMFRLSSNDFIKSLGTTIVAAIIAVLYSLTSQGDFNVFTVDWADVGGKVLNAVVIVATARLSEKLLSKDGKLFGRIG